MLSCLRPATNSLSDSLILLRLFISLVVSEQNFWKLINPKNIEHRYQLDSPCGLPKIIFSRKTLKPELFCDFWYYDRLYFFLKFPLNLACDIEGMKIFFP